MVAGTLALVYAPVCVELFKDWLRDPNYSHGLLVPVISGVILWSQRRRLAALPLSGSWIGVALMVVAAGLLVLGAAGAEVFTQRVSLILALGATVLALGGWSWVRGTAFPLAFLLFAVPLPYVIYYDITGPLQSLAAAVAMDGLVLIGIPAVKQGNIIHLPDLSLEVAEACSGIRSLYEFLALGALFARGLPLPWWGKVLVFLTTIPISVAGNAVRVWGTGVASHLVGSGAATGPAHEAVGLVVLAVALGILLLLGKVVRRLWPSAQTSCSCVSWPREPSRTGWVETAS